MLVDMSLLLKIKLPHVSEGQMNTVSISVVLNKSLNVQLEHI